MSAEPLPVPVAAPLPANSQGLDPFEGIDLEPLSPKQRRAVEMRLERKSRIEIAADLGTTVGHVDVILWTAKKKLGIPTNKKKTPFSRAQASPERREQMAREAEARLARRDLLRQKIAEKMAEERAERARRFRPPAPAPQPPPPPLDESLPTPLLAHLRNNRYDTRPRTVSADRLSRDEKRVAALTVYPDDVERPRTRGDCQDGPRPCPFVSCSHHLYLDADRTSGALKLTFPHIEVWEMQESCSLDVADRDGATLEAVGGMLNLTRERVRQIEASALLNAYGKHPGRER